MTAAPETAPRADDAPYAVAVQQLAAEMALSGEDGEMRLEASAMLLAARRGPLGAALVLARLAKIYKRMPETRREAGR